MEKIISSARWAISEDGRASIWRAISPSERAWQYAAYVVWAVAAITLLLAFWGLAFSPFTPQKLLGILVFLGFIALVGGALFLGLSLFSRVSRKMRLATLIGAPLPLLIIAGTFGTPNGALTALAFLVFMAMMGGGIGALTINGRSRKGLIAPGVFAAIGTAGFLSLIWMMFASSSETNEWLDDYDLPDRTLSAENPGLPGPLTVEMFSYGSGTDRHRAAYADDTSWTSTNVDGSKLLDGWDGWAGGLRTSYWGFDETALPIQGRVWAPQGVGPFPLILIVHGNHAMEDFSDAGYAYLGEHFASHGYTTVSVDENFLNGTNSSMVKPIGDSGLQEENDARGWLLLEHLKQWTEWSQQSGHPFEGRVDLDKIGLIGHSRGGEAVAIAAVFNELGAYPDDATLAFDYNFNIGAVIAIAPVDGQYEPRNVKRPLTDINYLVVHGSMDGDVISFMGSSQYSRIDFSRDEFRFKSSLYIEGANHGQFNTSWGNSDRSFPFDLFLNKKAIMPAQDQMQIARVYFTAFLDEALKGSETYRPIFADPSKAKGWISAKYLIANYEDNSFTPLANFEEDLDPTTGSTEGVQISSDALTKWYEEDAKLKWNPIDSQAALLAWDDDVYQNKPVYRLVAPEIFPVSDGSTALTFSVSQADTSTKPKGWEPPDGNETDDSVDEDADDALLDWSLVLVDTGGREARLPLSTHGLLPPQVASNVSKAKSLSSWDDKEVVMRRYTLPISDFKTEEVGFDREQIREIRFEFDRSPRGAIFIDDVGFTDVLTGN